MAPPSRRHRSAASIYTEEALDASIHSGLYHGASEDDLRLVKGFLQMLNNGKGCLRDAVEAVRVYGGVGVLHVAAMSGGLKVCSYLVEELRVNIDTVDDYGKTPLVCAIHSENLAVVKYLLDHGADKDKVDHHGLAPLHSAAGLVQQEGHVWYATPLCCYECWIHGMCKAPD